MARFGDFTLLDDLGSSAVADRHKATHARLGGPFFLKIYRRLPTWQHAELARRGDALIGVSHPNLAPHMGHGVVESVPFVVSPWLEGLDLAELASSLKDRRVNLTLDQCLLILADVTIAITALHRIAPDAQLVHGEVAIGHVRVAPDGGIRLTGLLTPRGLEPGELIDPRFDLAGVGALLYELVPLLRGGAARPPLPTQLDRTIRRALAIGPVNEHLTPSQFTERLTEVFSALKLSPDRAGLVDVVQRTLRAIEKKAAESRPRPPSDGIPELIPVTKSGPILEPLPPGPPMPAAVPVSTPPMAVRAPSRSPFAASAAPTPFTSPPSPPPTPTMPPAVATAGPPPVAAAGPSPFSAPAPVAAPSSFAAPAPLPFAAPRPAVPPVAVPPVAVPPVAVPPVAVPPVAVPPAAVPPWLRGPSAVPGFLAGAAGRSAETAAPAPTVQPTGAASLAPVFTSPALPPDITPPVVEPVEPVFSASVFSAPVLAAPVVAAPVVAAPVIAVPVVAAPVVAAPVVAAPVVVAPVVAAPVVAVPVVEQPVAPPVASPVVTPPVAAPPIAALSLAPSLAAPPVIMPPPTSAAPMRPATQPQFVVPSLPPRAAPGLPPTPPYPSSLSSLPGPPSLAGDTTQSTHSSAPPPPPELRPAAPTPSPPPTEPEPLSTLDHLDVRTTPIVLPAASLAMTTGPAIPTFSPLAAAAMSAPRPATMPMLPVIPTTAPPKKAPLLADTDDSTMESIPAFARPAPPSSASNPALTERTDPDAARPLRIEAQKALPAVRALLAARVVTDEQVDQAAAEQAARGGRTVEILVAHGWCSDDDVADCLARSAARPRLVDSVLVVKDQTLLKRLPQTYALARRLLPLALDGGTLVLAVADPFDRRVIDEVRDLVHAVDVDVGVAARAALTQATLKAFADLHGAQVAGSGPRVLLCTADDTKAQQFGARLAQEGMQVEHVVDGVTARTIIQTRPPDAVITAHDLPGVDGQGLLLAARHGEKTVELPVFILGPRSDDDLMARVLDLGADDYFGEPVRPDVMVAKLRRAVGKATTRPTTLSTPATPAIPSTPQFTTPPPLPRKAPPMTTLASTEGFAFDDLPDLPPEFDASSSAADVPAMPTGVMGTLRQMSLPEIVQSLEMGRKTASVDIVPQDGEKGAIAFESGAIKFAECGTLVGNEAFFALMRHKEGFFRIHYGDAPKSINIDAPTTFLLLEAMRLMDEEGA